jgi:hypothetical protein
MPRSLNLYNTQTQSPFYAVRNKIACSMIGRTIGVLAKSGAIAHGIVTSVHLEAGAPRLLVDGRAYGLEQVLTAMPASFS